MDHLRLVWQVGEALLETVTFEDDPEGTRYNVLLALQEMVTNVLRHAYDLDETKPVEVLFNLSGTAIDIELRDQGPAFNPLAHDTSGLDEGEEMPEEIGGYGIHIAKVVMDEVDYQRKQGWNHLYLRKLVGKAAHAFRT
jgi:anti-sigma regulatory factor (Ser/Thr protein kinase)